MIDDSITTTISKPYLPDVINYETDIAPYPLIKLCAGVGSGKNTFAGHLMNGAPELGIPKKTVLLITSRKAKVVETLADDIIDISHMIGDSRSIGDILRHTHFGLDTYRREIADDPRGWGNIVQRSAACTNAFIETYHQHVYDPNDPSTHLWNRFDMIIVDEAHSLVMDATYQSAPFHVWELVQETVKRIELARKNEQLPLDQRDPDVKPPICQNVILMTGTPEAVRYLDMPACLHLLDK